MGESNQFKKSVFENIGVNRKVTCSYGSAFDKRLFFIERMVDTVKSCMSSANLANIEKRRDHSLIHVQDGNIILHVKKGK